MKTRSCVRCAHARVAHLDQTGQCLASVAQVGADGYYQGQGVCGCTGYEQPAGLPLRTLTRVMGWAVRGLS